MARVQRQPMDQDRHVVTSVSSVDGITPFPLEVNPTTGRLLVDVTGGGGSTGNVGIDPVGQNGVNYDSIVYTNTSTTIDTYVYKTGGVAGTNTATITITYTDTTKTQISTVVRT